MRGACRDGFEFVAGEWVRASWSLGLLRGKLSDEKEKAFPAAWTDPWTVRLCWVGGWSGGVRAHLVRARFLLTVEQKQQTGASGVFAVGRMP